MPNDRTFEVVGDQYHILAYHNFHISFIKEKDKEKLWQQDAILNTVD